MSGGGTGDTQSWWVDAAGAERGAGGCRVVTRTLAPRLSTGSCRSLAASAAWAKEVGDLVFPCKPLTQRRAPAGERRRALGESAAQTPQLRCRRRASTSSLGPGSTSVWEPAPHAFPEALPSGRLVDRWAAHSFPGWDAEDPECHKTGSPGEERLSPAGRAAACARSCPRGHIWAWALFRCAHTCANRRAQGATLTALLGSLSPGEDSGNQRTGRHWSRRARDSCRKEALLASR